MKQKIYKKIILVVLVFWFAFAPVFQAQAITHPIVVTDIAHTKVAVKKGILDKIFQGIQKVTDKLSLTSLGLPGSGAARGAVIKTADGACEVTKKGLSAVDSLDNFGSVEALAGSAGKLTKLTAQISILTAVKNCKQATLTAASAPGTSLQELVTRSGDMAKLAIDISSIEARIEKLKETRSEVNVSIWKGVAMRILLNAQSRLTTRLVNNLINKYKIGNVLQYVDAASTLIYTKDYIQKNFPDNKDKMILRSILTNDAFGNKILPSVRAKASRALAYVPHELDIADPDYFIKLAQAGTGEADPFLLQTVMEDEAARAKANGDEAAKDEANSGEGFVPVRNCKGAIAQQADFDGKSRIYQQEVATQEKVLNKLSDDMHANPGEDYAEDIETAQKALTEAKKKMNALPETSRPIVDFCDKIQNPGASVAKSINGYLTSHLGNATNIRPENLPFFANFIESIASNFVGSIIEGQKPGLNILTDAGFKAANVAASSFLENTADTRKLKNVEAKANADSLIFTIEKTENSGNEYKFTWNADDIDNVILMQITGPRNYRKNLSESAGVMAESLTVGGDYIFKAYDKNSQVLASKTFVLRFDAGPGQINLPPAITASGVDGIINSTVQPSTRVTHEDIIQDCMRDGYPRSYCEQQNPPPHIEAGSAGGVCGGNYTSRAICIQQTGDQAYCDQLCGSVSGAFTSRPTESIRGWKAPASGLTPRTRME